MNKEQRIEEIEKEIDRLVKRYNGQEEIECKIDNLEIKLDDLEYNTYFLNENEINKCYEELNFEDYEEIVDAEYNKRTKKLYIYYLDKDKDRCCYDQASKEAIRRIVGGMYE